MQLGMSPPQRFYGMALMKENDLILIVHLGNRYLKKLEPRKNFHSKRGTLDFSSLIGLPYGIRLGHYEVFEPTIEDIIMYGLRRETQIVYPKDACYICFKLSLKNGDRVIEVGTGSGALTVLFSRAVGPAGMVVSFEKEERHYKNARKNVERFAGPSSVDLRLADVMDFNTRGNLSSEHGEREGKASTALLVEGATRAPLIEQDGREFDAAFIDVREPWSVTEKVWASLKASGSVGIIVPTTNQVSETLRGLQPFFGDVEVLEILLRKYKTVADRLRPDDRMVAHTGYLIFGRKVEESASAEPRIGLSLPDTDLV
jgi:tRNA (adenine57-N1/adenine58-N1)-methyltransferase catalytic subunit